MTLLSPSLRQHRRLLAALLLLAFSAGGLLRDRLPGEPSGARWGLALLLGLAWMGGRLHEALRRGGTLDLLDERAAGDE